MRPYLTLTAARAEDTPESLVKPEALHAYLLNPALSLPARVKAISDAASTLVHADADTATLIKHLAHYRKAVSVLAPKINHQLVGLLLPPNQQDLEFNRLCSELYARLAAVCKRVILTAPDSLDLSSQAAVEVAQACYWAIHFLGETLHCAYCSYNHAPEECWYEIHQIYQYSASTRIETAAVHIEEEAKVRNIRHVYIRVLLLGLCDPYNFPFRAVQAVFKALGDWAKLARLSTTTGHTGPCIFLINADADQPALPTLASAAPSVESAELYLDTTELVAVLRRDLDEQPCRNLAPSELKGQMVKELESRETLRKLIVRWGTQPMRRSNRQRSTHQCDVLVGLQSVAGFLDAHHAGTATADLGDRQRLQLIDESENGARVGIGEKDAVYVRVGELIALRKQHEAEPQDWRVGMISWAHTNVNHEFQFGFFKFIDNAVPVSVRHPVPKDNSAGFNRPGTGLWVVRKNDGTRSASLIVDNSYYRPGGSISVERGHLRYLLEIRDVVLSTRCFLWFDVSLSDSTPQGAAELVLPGFEHIA